MKIYSNIIKIAWRLTWKHKYLWFFGVFATFLGNTGEYEVIMRAIGGNMQIDFIAGFKKFAETGVFSFNAVANFFRLLLEQPFYMISILFFILVLLLIFVFIIWLSNVSQIAIIHDSALLYGKKDIKDPGIQSGVEIGSKYFWKVFSLNILAKVLIIVLLWVIGLPVLITTGTSNQALGNLFFGFLFLLGIPVAIGISFIIKYAIGFIVIKEKSIKESLIDGSKLFAKNWLVSFELAAILVGVVFATFLFIIFVFFNLKQFFVYLSGLVALYLPALSFWMVAVISPLLVLVVVTFIWSIATVFMTSSWTGLFVQLISGGGSSKLKRIFDK